MRLVTWNINSVRLRLGLIKKLMDDLNPDVLCLQETKVQNIDFPYFFFHEHGYPYIFVEGIKSYNGVAVISKIPLSNNQHHIWCNKHDARHVHTLLDQEIELHNVYVPAGGDIPDPQVNDKFQHKLQFLDELTHWWKQQEPRQRQIIVGDLNVAPLPNDVWSHRQLLNVVSHTPTEVDRLNLLQSTGGWVDVLRQMIPESEKLFTWWSYRNQDWKKSNRGRRLDHIWISPDLLPRLKSANVLAEARDWPQPSDHVPVMIELG